MERELTVNINAASLPKKAAAVLLGAVLLGTMWRIRGDTSFGGFWGMLAVSVAFILYIFSLCGRTSKTRAEYFAVTALMCAITNGGWGTLNSQICGTLNSSVEFSDGYIHFVDINPWSGVAIMLLLGFSWVPFLGAFLGIYFSSRKYTLKSFVEIVILYYASLNIFKATLAHPVLKLINPQAVTLFSQGLADQGIALSPWKAYMSNYSDMVFAKGIPGGRNYFTSVAVIAGTLAAVAVILFFAVRFKDVRASRFMFLSCAAFAVGITVADLFILFQHGGAGGAVKAHEGFAGWSFWEYFTGFFSGALLMIPIVFSDKERAVFAGKTEIISSESLPQPVPMIIQLFIAFLLPFGASLTVPLSEGIGELFNGTEFIVIIICALLFLIAGVFLVYRYMFKKEQSEMYPQPFYSTAKYLLVLYFLAVNLIYWFTGNAYAVRPPVSLINIIMLASLIVFALLYCGVFISTFKINGKREKQDAEISE